MKSNIHRSYIWDYLHRVVSPTIWIIGLFRCPYLTNSTIDLKSRQDCIGKSYGHDNFIPTAWFKDFMADSEKLISIFNNC